MRREVAPQLAEVRHLTGPTDIRQRREQRGLDDRPQQHVRAQGERIRSMAGAHVVAGESLARGTQPIAAILTVEALTAGRPLQEQVDTALENRDLEWVTGFCEVRRRVAKNGLQLLGPVELGQKELGRIQLHHRVRRVGEQHAEAPQEVLKGPMVTLHERLAGAEGLAQQLLVLATEIRARQVAEELRHDVAGTIRQRYPVERRRTVRVRRRHLDAVKLVVHAHEVRVTGLLPIVILRADPEQGEHGLSELLLERFSETGSGQGLVEAVQRTSEERRLLAGRDHVAALVDEALEPVGPAPMRREHRLGNSLARGPIEPDFNLGRLLLKSLQCAEVWPVEGSGARLTLDVGLHQFAGRRKADDQLEVGSVRHGVLCVLSRVRSAFVIRLSADERPGPVKLLGQHEPRHLVRQGQSRQGQLPCRAPQHGRSETERAADQEGYARRRAHRTLFQVPREFP